jgi:hypothetical protein
MLPPTVLTSWREMSRFLLLGLMGGLLAGAGGVIRQVSALPPPSSGESQASSSVANPVDDQQIRILAETLDRAATMVSTTLYKRMEEKVLIAEAVRQWYQAMDVPLPEAVHQRLVTVPNTPQDRLQLLREIRRQLRDHPKLRGTQSLLLGLQGFTQATEGHCSVTWRRSGVAQTFSVDLDFGVGLELEGWTGLGWTAYQWERSLAMRRYPPHGYIGPVPAPDKLSAPLHYPWRVRRVIPGSPAHFAGIQKGDVITHYRGTALTPENAHRLFQEWAYAPMVLDPVTGRPLSPSYHLTLQRGPERIELRLAAQEQYQAECVYGVQRHSDGSWDWWLDRTERIGYIRLGPLEMYAPAQFRAALEELQRQRCRGLILDLRWCPGGYVQSTIEICSMLLPANTVIARLQYPDDRPGPPIPIEPEELRTTPSQWTCLKLPLVVLIGPETLGGGEMIAAALRDHNRGLLAGQRSAGRAALQTLLNLEVAELQLRITTALMLRPNGQPRHRFPNSQPTDPWGLRPDPGWEIPLGATARRELFRQIESYTLRLPTSREALPLDDPRYDSVRYTALQQFRQHLQKLSSPAP